MTDFSLLSYASTTVAYTLLAILVAQKYLRRYTDRALLTASILTATWAFALVAQSLWGYPGFHIRYTLELVRDAAWIGVLLALIRDAGRTGIISPRLFRLAGIVTVALVAILLGNSLLDHVLDASLLDGRTRVVGQLMLALLGICLVEQIWRNTTSFRRSSIKYLCIGVASLFAFDFLMYADALLFGKISESFWSARGGINALIAPLFAISMINTRKQPVDFHMSRAAVFHAGTLVFAGVYLLFVAAGGYYVRALGGEWGEALQVLVMAALLTFLAMLLTSRRFRSRLMMFISQNFFDYKYDYRDEWLKMTQIFANLSDEPPLPERVISILANLVESQRGLLWIRDDQDNYTLQSAIGLKPPRFTVIDSNAELVTFFNEREWIIDLAEYASNPVMYNLMEIPDAIQDVQDSWLIIPLYLGNELYGICVVGRPYAKVELNWENFDLIRVVARQSCNVLAQAEAQGRLSRAMQFEAVNKASAFMVHDLKTLIAQLTLLVRNAPKHRHNPAFIDDMIQTTEHAVRKMSNLVEHIRKPQEDSDALQPVDLYHMLEMLMDNHAHSQPQPQLDPSSPRATVYADPEQLRTILSHLIQNALDATPPDGEVLLTMKTSKDHVVLFIQDTGSGMTEEFIRIRLFKPFESTKGLTGMGIGAYQAREYVKQIGGSIDVTSEPGVGSCFSIRFPLAAPVSKRNDDDSLTAIKSAS
ncbi:MAG: PEP-CTERM system histidine kinase PrsK [Marinobacter sp.]|nr:PEP-CTERM system histidine kinase PrsK [Marinobacter sp.]